METIDLYPMILKRKSTRDYDPAPLNKEILKKISDSLQTLQPMNDDIKTEYRIISSDQVRRTMRKAPHYIAAFSEEKAQYLPNIGFTLQQMNLFLAANGLGCCWQGIPQPIREVRELTDLEFVILMAFGHAKETPYRMTVSEFNRKPLSKISDLSGMTELLEAARLAPSSINSQAWYFTGNETRIHAYISKPGFFRRLFAPSLLQIDVGIALCHLKIAAEHFGKQATVSHTPTEQTPPSKGYTYIATLTLS